MRLKTALKVKLMDFAVPRASAKYMQWARMVERQIQLFYVVLKVHISL